MKADIEIRKGRDRAQGFYVISAVDPFFDDFFEAQEQLIAIILGWADSIGMS